MLVINESARLEALVVFRQQMDGEVRLHLDRRAHVPPDLDRLIRLIAVDAPVCPNLEPRWDSVQPDFLAAGGFDHDVAVALFLGRHRQGDERPRVIEHHDKRDF